MAAKVSIIIPIYNTEKYLVRCMDSVLRQTLEEIEIILVDDQSPDNAPAMCDEYALSDSRIRVIHKKNGGLGLARNSGLEIATGEYVAFLDSDDYVDKRMYELLYQTATENDCQLVMSGYNFVDRHGKVSDCTNTMPKELYKGNRVKELLLATLGASPSDLADNIMGMSVWRGIYSMKTIRENHIRFHSEREFICEDAIFHIDFFHHIQRAYIIEEPLYFYCNNPGSLSRVFRKDRFEKDKILYQKEYEMLDTYGSLADGKTYIDRMFLTFTRVFLTEAVYQLKTGEAMVWIKNTLSDDLLRKILADYPYNRNPRKQRVFNMAMRHKAYLAILLFLKIAAYRKRNFYQE